MAPPLAAVLSQRYEPLRAARVSSVTAFFVTQVMASSTPKNILDDVAMVLDEEAEVFVVKMWRLLIYETEAKKLGLVK